MGKGLSMICCSYCCYILLSVFVVITFSKEDLLLCSWFRAAGYQRQSDIESWKLEKYVPGTCGCFSGNIGIFGYIKK